MKLTKKNSYLFFETPCIMFKVAYIKYKIQGVSKKGKSSISIVSWSKFTPVSFYLGYFSTSHSIDCWKLSKNVQIKWKLINILQKKLLWKILKILYFLFLWGNYEIQISSKSFFFFLNIWFLCTADYVLHRNIFVGGKLPRKV